jgi:hypothetical protein
LRDRFSIRGFYENFSLCIMLCAFKKKERTFACFFDPAPALEAGNGAGAAFLPEALGGYH